MFKKGESGNNKGRPKMSESEKQAKKDFISKLKQYSPLALETLIDVMKSDTAKSADKVRAAEFVIEKTYGKDFYVYDDNNQDQEQQINLVIKHIRRERQGENKSVVDEVDECENEEDW